jgi:hypothetical protein
MKSTVWETRVVQPVLLAHTAGTPIQDSGRRRFDEITMSTLIA